MLLNTSYEDIPISIDIDVRTHDTFDIKVTVQNNDSKKKPIVSIDLVLFNPLKSNAKLKLALFYRNNDLTMDSKYRKPRLSQHILATSFDYLVTMGILKNDTPVSLEADGHRCYSDSMKGLGSWMTKRTIEKAHSSVLIAKMVRTIKEYLMLAEPDVCEADNEVIASLDNDFTDVIKKALVEYDGDSDSDSDSDSDGGSSSNKRYEGHVKSMFCAFQNQLKLVKYYESLGFHAKCGLFGYTYNRGITTMMYASVKDVIQSIAA
jgi:hypothetical protein